MGVNPMQKMKRNSTLIGLVIGLTIGLVICAGLYMFLTNPATKIGISKGNSVSVSVLNTAIKSGQKISTANIVTKVMNIDDVPQNAVSVSTDVVAKIDLAPGTILTAGMLNTTLDQLTNDLREQEYNMITLPSELTVGDFIDIRLQLPNGGDYIVVSKKQVIKCNSTTVWLNMYEEEIELMSNAVIEYYIMAGSKLYATTYTDPGIQTAAVGTYVPNETVSILISSNPNIKNYINADRYTDRLKSIRNNHINISVDKYSDTAIQNIENSMKEEIQTLKESREAYFGVLNSAQ